MTTPRSHAALAVAPITFVEVKLRSGTVLGPGRALGYEWGHDGEAKGDSNA